MNIVEEPEVRQAELKEEVQPAVDPFLAGLKQVADYSLPRDRQLRQTDSDLDQVRANAAKACSACPGYCCLAFTLQAASIEEIRKADMELKLQQENLEAEITRKRRQMKENLRADDDVPIELYKSLVAALFADYRQLADVRRWKYANEFFAKNAVYIGPQPGSDFAWRPRHIYTCKQFNTKTAQCMAYDSRPYTCSMYVCGAAQHGHTPGIDQMVAHPDTTPQTLRLLKGSPHEVRVWPKEKPQWLVEVEESAKAEAVVCLKIEHDALAEDTKPAMPCS